MKITEAVVAANLIKTEYGSILLNLPSKQLTSILQLANFLEVEGLHEINLSQNYLKLIDEVLAQCRGLRSLNLSVNHIKDIQHLENLSKLEVLNLSTNKISKIENLDSLVSLRSLDLSVNYIEKMENLNLPKLESLLLNANQLKHIENTEKLVSLRRLEVSKNKIKALGSLGLAPKNRSLQTLNCSYNEIPVEYLDDLTVALKNLPALSDLNLSGNEITMNKHYKYQIVNFNNIKVLDNLEIKGYVKEHLENLRKTNDYNKLVDDTKAEYFQRLHEENAIKNSIKAMIRSQEDEVDRLFDTYQRNMEEDLDKFVEFMAFFTKKKQRGEKVDIDQETLDQWKTKIMAAEKERQRLTEIALANQEKIKKNYLDSKLSTTKLTQKLYEISMNQPDAWREIKTKEWEQMIKEEEEMRQMDKKHVDEENSEDEEVYDDLEREMRMNLGGRASGFEEGKKSAARQQRDFENELEQFDSQNNSDKNIPDYTDQPIVEALMRNRQKQGGVAEEENQENNDRKSGDGKKSKKDKKRRTSKEPKADREMDPEIGEVKGGKPDASKKKTGKKPKNKAEVNVENVEGEEEKTNNNEAGQTSGKKSGKKSEGSSKTKGKNKGATSKEASDKKLNSNQKTKNCNIF